MGKEDNATAAGGTREERLAAKLRENLKRRKAQARAASAGGDGDVGIIAAGGGETLSKAPRKS